MNQRLPIFQKSDSGSIRFKRQPIQEKGLRRYTLALIFMVAFLVLFVRLFQLTVVRGAYFRQLAESNRIREVPVPAPRGVIEDRKGIPIAISSTDKEKSDRRYSDEEALAPVVGYIQIADKTDLEKDSCETRLRPNDFVGRSGIESLYECQLRGIKGKKLVEVDARGKERKLISFIPPRPGKTVPISIDSYLQKVAYEALLTRIENSGGIVELREKRAAVVALDPKNGAILAMVSTPSFQPSAFSHGLRDQIDSYLTDEKKPLLNRVVQGIYPPGSVFKPFIAIGALEDKLITPDFTIVDTGVIEAGPLKFGNWYFLEYGKLEGTVDMVKGLRRSNDIYFYKLGEKMGDSKIKKWATVFGFGSKTGVPFPEQAGLVPSAFWKKEVLKERWFLGDTYNLSIGQGYLQTTPIQVVQAMTAIVNGGRLCQPNFEKTGTGQCHSLAISEKTLSVVREGMHQACLPGGTGWPFFEFKVKNAQLKLPTPSPAPTNQQPDDPTTKRIEVGCKTGTAESHLPSGLPHAWFTVFAPFENPEIVLTVMIEESGQGSNVAAPVAKQILKAYFERNE